MQVQLYIIISLLLGGFFLLAVIFHHYWRPFKLVCFGKQAQGTIEDFVTEMFVPYSLEEYDVDYPVIAFETADGKKVKEKYDTLRSNLVKGAKVKVWYDPANPQLFFPLLTRTDVYIFCIGLLVGTGILVIGIYQLWKR